MVADLGAAFLPEAGVFLGAAAFLVAVVFFTLGAAAACAAGGCSCGGVVVQQGARGGLAALQRRAHRTGRLAGEAPSRVR